MAGAPARSTNYARWLWVPAFAGTTPIVWLATRPHIQHVAVLRAHLIDPFCRGIRVDAGLLLMDRHQRGLDVRLHLAAVAADEDLGDLFDQAPDLVLLSRDQVLDISLWPAAAREA